MAGESEKQIAFALKIGPRTVHQYVSSIYAHFGVSSRGELLAHVFSEISSIDRKPPFGAAAH